MLLRELFEAEEKTAAIAFGRMNPPTIGHEKLVNVIASQKADPFLFITQSQKPKTDPLPFNIKLEFAKAAFPNVTVGDAGVRTIIQALQKVEQMGYAHLIYVAGSDRLEDFTELLNKYNGKDYTFKSIKVISAGERDPDAEGAEGMSASKMRAAATEGNFEAFAQGLPKGLHNNAKNVFSAVRTGMGIKELEPAEGLGDDEKRAFKRQELQHELGDEKNNIQISINGKAWKVIPGKGYADSPEERSYLNGMKRWAEKKSAATSKKWEVSLTGADPSKS
jgi:hypothetical protein